MSGDDLTPALTPPQARILAQVREHGRRIYNGRARRPVERLEALGLVSVDWDMRPQTKGNGIELVYAITVRPAAMTPAGSGFAEGQPYYEIYPASGPDAFSTKRNPTCAALGTAEHNAREYSRDGRAYVVEHIDAEARRSKVSEFRGGRKVRRS